ncbi:MAG: hypothetical protein RBU37_17810, partial [Myxococcota bacterium]|nr:hypothetical protein [Myxococcota bacterium]
MFGDELPKVGEQVGRFKLLKLLGQGGTSAVFEVIEDGTGRSAALKIILPSVVRKVQGASAR